MPLTISTKYMVLNFVTVTVQSLCKILRNIYVFFSSNSSTALSVSRPPRSRGYEFTLRHATLGSTLL